MTPITEAILTQASDLQPGSLPATGPVAASLRLLGSLLTHLPLPGSRLAHLPLPGSLLAHLRLLRSEDGPGAAVLRDLGLDHEPPCKAFDLTDIHHGLDTLRTRLLDTSQGWRGS